MRLSYKNTTFCYKILLLSTLIAFTGCKSMEPVVMPKMQTMPGAFNRIENSPEHLLNWKEIFTDRELVSLIDTALNTNFELKSEMQQIIVAEANLKLAKASMLPGLNTSITAGLDRFGKYTMNGVGNYDTNLSPNVSTNQQIPTPTPDYFMGFRSSWEIDIWGKLSKRKEAAYSRYLATKMGQQWLRTQVVAQVAQLYFELIALDKHAEILKRNIALQKKGVEIIEAQMAGGRATSLAVSQFKAQMMATQGSSYQITQAIVKTENELNNLLGRFPAPIKRDSSSITRVLPDQIYAGIPVRVILNRPDIKQAELELRAAKADVQAARKALLPSFTLDAYSGINSFKLPLLFSPGSLASGVLGGLTAPIFNRGALKNGNRIANAAQLSAFYNYQRTVLQGYQEVSTQLSAIDNYKRAYQLKTSEVGELKTALSTANDLYLAGYASYLEVIVAQGSMLNSEIEQVGLKRDSYITLINLFRALGGNISE
ncbi:RND transporter [Pedobacter cryoconitis]|uniref:RND transporter n=2 Tax=Pedobacter cryoconitis TaxID=188932 RepID=A0A127VBM7_9SPHI|nr:RND transporter [Pedobacter cryoconitis]